MKNEFLKKNVAWSIFLLFMLLLSGVGFSSCSDDDESGIPDSASSWVKLSKNAEFIVEGNDLTIIPEFDSAETGKLDYVWTSSNTNIASVVKNSDNSATITALAAGKATIKITSATNKQITAMCAITVTAIPVESPIRILAIGNSFSQDATEQYLYELAEAAGIETIIANAYIGGCSLATHLANANSNSGSYSYRKQKDGVVTSRTSVRLSEALADEDWDYISLQQVSGNSGEYETFVVSLPGLVEYVKGKATNPEMKLMLHQTWAYAKTSSHGDFGKYDKDQTIMYEAIVDAVNRAANLVDIDIVIPSGTAIQNGRTSYLGDNFCRDGYHLETTYGRYTAACTWFEKIYGRDVIGNPYAPEDLHSYKVEIAQHAAHYAVLKPNEVTVLENYTNLPIDTEIMKAPIYIDFGSSISSAPWNNITSHLATTEGINLVDEDGDNTKFKIRVSNSFGGIWGGAGSEPTGTITVEGFDMPRNVFADGLLVNSDTSGELLISNLDPTKKYTLTIYGLRWNSGVDRMTNYKITGMDIYNYPLAVGVANNSSNASIIPSKYIKATAIAPDASGNIAIEVSRGEDNPHQALINAIQIKLAE